MADLIDQARAWIAGDPDPDTRAEMERLLESGDPQELAARLGSPLEFGTAGLRGPMGAGPSRMNLAVVIKATAGLAAHLSQHPGGQVVVGFDARPRSKDFAEATAGVLSAHGIPVVHFAEVTPTPLVAFAAKHLAAVAAVVLTASHNPPGDNGYKVYGSNAAQIIPPEDTEIARHIEETGPANEIPRDEDVFDGHHDLVEAVPRSILDAYWSEVSSVRLRNRGSSLSIVYTPIHGVGGKTIGEMFARAGHHQLVMVPEQAEPDGTFPTVSFPNPEEPGALDLARDLGEERDADLILANDPDADRLAAMVASDDGFRLLSGNELGVLIADYLLEGYRDPERPIVASSVVSSPMITLVAAAHGARHEVTLTGFKWIANAGLALEEAGEGRFVFGYEEALGYTVGSVVRDKDGLSAALIFADLAADAGDRGEIVLDRMLALWRAHGIWASAQVSIPGEPDALVAAVDSLASRPPSSLGGRRVADVTDYRKGAESRPPWLGAQDLVELSLGDAGRALVRPSGTEPKLKIYVDLMTPYVDGAENRHEELRRAAAALGKELAGMMGL
ncbi:MAG: phospho-sugar mutase [Acidimicrobiia bacterium]